VTLDEHRVNETPEPLEVGPSASRIKVCLVCSHGGHLTEMFQIEEAFEGHDTFYLCYDAETTRAVPNAYRVPNMARNPIEFVKNLFRVFAVFRKERPDLAVSTGAEIALPVALIAKLLRVPMVYIECGAQVAHPSFTGRVMYWLADEFYVQWKELVAVYGPRAKFRGSLIDEDVPIQGDRSAERRMKVTLVHPALVRAFSSDQPPMGLAYLASVLEQHGCEVRVIDANAEKLSLTEVTRIIVQQAPGMIGVTVTTPLLPSALEMARELGRRLDPRPVLVAGGPHATVRPEDLLVDGAFDYVVRAEGELTIAELVEALLAGKDAEGIAGISWRRGGTVIHNPDRGLCSRLEQFPHPDWSLFPLKCFSSYVRRNDYCLPIMTSRGCPFSCTFCYKGIFGRRLRMRTAEDVVNEWQFLVERYGAREIAVVDDVFTLRIDRVIQICELLVARGLDKVPWSTTNGIRVDQVSAELFAAMRRAGCYRVYFGIESGVQRVIDTLQKGITLDQARHAVRLAKEAGLEVGGYFMLGNAGETGPDMDATIGFALELELDYAQFAIATPYPGTQMYATIEKHGTILISSWEDLATFGRLVFTMGELTPNLVAGKFRKAIWQFYFRPRFLLRQAHELSSWTGLRHRILGAAVVIKLALFGGR